MEEVIRIHSVALAPQTMMITCLRIGICISTLKLEYFRNYTSSLILCCSCISEIYSKALGEMAHLFGPVLFIAT